MSRIIVVALSLVIGAAAQRDAPPLQVVTFNVRFGTAPDHQHAWPHRREFVQDVVARLAPHVLGLQEALGFQLEAIAESLPGHRVLGEDRRGGTADEYSALLVDETRLEIVEHGQFWLSERPDAVASMGWDAALPRICTWAVLRDRQSDARFQVLNTHFDHRGSKARHESALLMVARAAQRDLPTVLMGDLNAGVESAPLRALRAAGYADTRALRHPDAPPVGTFTNFTKIVGTQRIDHILVRGPWVTTEAEIVQWQRDGRFPSDHLPVRATLVLQLGPLGQFVPRVGDEDRALSEGLFLARGHTVWRDATGGWRMLAGGGARWLGQDLSGPRWARERDRAVLRPEQVATAPFVFRAERWWRIAAAAPEADGQRAIWLASSDDGIAFAPEAAPAFRQQDASDPMVMRVGGDFYCYYAHAGRAPRIQARVSRDLKAWSEPVDVCFGGRGGSGPASAAAPFVLRRGGTFFLLRTGLTADPGARATYVYRSSDPLNFGRDDDAGLVAVLPVSGAEVVRAGDDEWITSEAVPAGGIRIRRLLWSE